MSNEVKSTQYMAGKIEKVNIINNMPVQDGSISNGGISGEDYTEFKGAASRSTENAADIADLTAAQESDHAEIGELKSDLSNLDNEVNTNLFTKKVGKNLFDKSSTNIILGYFINGEDGSLASNEEYFVSDFCMVEPNRNYVMARATQTYTRVAYYDANKAFISVSDRLPSVINQVVTTPSNCHYLKFSGKKDLLINGSIQLEKGSIPTSYEEYKSAIVIKMSATPIVNTIVVGKTIGCDYDNLQDAIDNANDSETNPVTIIVLQGEYERFSMTDSDRRLRHISMIGVDRDRCIIRSDTGNYNTPPAEIWSTGVFRNLSFIMKATAESYVSGGSFDYAYAMHSDFGSCDTSFENCYLYSNAGPAIGVGLFKDEKLRFWNCEMISECDGTFGRDLGGAFIHTATINDQTNQYVELKNCHIINKNYTNALILRVYEKATGATQSAVVQNCFIYPSALVNDGFLSPYSFGNNLSKLNA